jgi:hypothetical protein
MTTKQLRQSVPVPTHLLSTDGTATEDNLGYSSLAEVRDVLNPVGSSLGTTGTVNLDMAALNGTYQTITLTGNVTFTTSNRAAGRSVTLRLVEGGTASRDVTFPAGWVFVGTAPPAAIDDELAIVTVTFFGTADTDAVAAAAVQA